MALKNMKVEPRREIIEQGLGLGVLMAWIVAAYPIASWIVAYNQPIRGENLILAWILSWIGGLIIVFVGFWLVVGTWYLAHGMGEGISQLMTTLGWDPRPKQRYKEHLGVRYLADVDGNIQYDQQRRPIRA